MSALPPKTGAASDFHVFCLLDGRRLLMLTEAWSAAMLATTAM